MIHTAFVVEDEPLINKTTQKLLVKSGHVQATEGYLGAMPALERLREMTACGQKCPEVVFLDIQMPELTGWDFLALFQQEACAGCTKVFMLTSSISLDDRTRAAHFAEVRDYIVKPLTLEKIENVVRLLNQN